MDWAGSKVEDGVLELLVQIYLKLRVLLSAIVAVARRLKINNDQYCWVEREVKGYMKDFGT